MSEIRVKEELTHMLRRLSNGLRTEGYDVYMADVLDLAADEVVALRKDVDMALTSEKRRIAERDEARKFCACVA